MKSNFYTLCFLLPCLAGLNAQSQLFIDTSFTAEQMVMDFFANTCAIPSNVIFTGSPGTMAYFEGANTNIGVNAGIVISTGNVEQIANPAEMFANGTWFADGDADLEALAGNNAGSYDASILEFDLTVQEGGELNFKYAFGSEEYPEFVGLQFNDVFGFLVTPPSETTATNIAMIPGTNDPVAINFVNANLNAQYFVDNATNGNPDIVFGGMTTPLLATFSAVGGNTYHIKIGVADIGDVAFDSGVFIGIESLCGDSLLTPPAEAIATVNNNTVSFENNSRYATSWHWDFGDNTSSDERYPEPHSYAQAGAYTVTLSTQNWCCTDTYSFTVTVDEVTRVEETGRKSFSMAPNPASNWVQVSIPTSEELNYQVVDLAGRTVMQGTTVGDSHKIDISLLNPGAYLFVVTSEQGVFTEKLMVK